MQVYCGWQMPYPVQYHYILQKLLKDFPPVNFAVLKQRYLPLIEESHLDEEFPEDSQG